MVCHFPAGTNPDASCGYDRLPLYPAEGDLVRIRCIPPEDAAAPRLLLRVGGSEQTVSGSPDEKTAPGCILFHAGPFHAGTRVEYAFSFDRTPYRFTVRSRTVLERCSALAQSAGEILAHCVLRDGSGLRLRFSKNGRGVRVDVSQTDQGFPDEAESSAEAALNLPGGGRLRVLRSPFSVIFETAGGKPLLVFDQTRHTALFTRDESGGIRSFSLSCGAAGRGFYGCGEKFDRVNQRGRSPRNVVYEHYTRQGEHTYLPVPWLFTESGWGLFSASECETGFNLKNSNEGHALLSVNGSVGREGFAPLYFLFGTPEILLRELHRLTGPCALPPAWAFGPWMSANGWATQSEAMEQVRRMKELDIPATVLVLEAWSDESTFYIWNGAKYTPRPGGEFSYKDFAFSPDGPWPDPKAFSQALQKAGLHLVLWQIPAIKDAAENGCTQLAIDEKEAIESGYCVKNADGTPYRIPDRWFAHSLLLDFSNPEAAEWWFRKRRYLRDELHVEGFKTDGGEFIYDPEARFRNGKTGLEMRNLYPAEYTQAYYDFLQSGGRPGIVFSRAGYSGSQSRPLHWAGDQLSTFAELRAQLTAGLSAGLSGIPFWGFDLSGFAGELPSTELYLRAAALAVFSPVMQFHSEPRSGQYGDARRRDWINDRSPWNMARVNGAPEIIGLYRGYAKLRMALLPYIYSEAKNCAATARPLLCHLVYEYPEDEAVFDLENEYLFGRKLLVAPLLEKNRDEREIYLPAGDWFDFWTGKPYAGRKRISVKCPPGGIPVFSRDTAFLEKTVMQPDGRAKR